MSANTSARAGSPVADWTPNLVVRKKRTDTINLVDPAPLADDQLYTVAVVQERIDYAKQRLQSTIRYLTPNSEKLLQIYLNSCIDFCVNENYYDGNWDLKKKELIDGLRKFEHDICTQDFLHTVTASDLLKDLVGFRTYVYWARYGDYAAHLVARLRKASGEKPATQFADKISGQHQWSEISRNIKYESPLFNQSGSLVPSQVPTTYAVYKGCQRAGIDFYNMIHLIHLYADRNTAFHLGLQENLEKANYHTIAQDIYKDLKDLASVCRSGMAADETVMRTILEQLRDEWFDSSADPNNPQSWDNKNAIKAVHNALQAKKAIKIKNDAEIAKKAAIRLGLDTESEDLLVQAATDHLGLLPPKGPGYSAKGKGKGKAVKEDFDVSDRKKAWDTIMALQRGQYNSMQYTLVKQRGINRMVSSYRKRYGDNPPI
ncbi:MAG: hypothetical protein Q9178_007269 [Gyalolechia marmorata]